MPNLNLKKANPERSIHDRGDKFSIHVLQGKLMPDASKYKSLYAFALI
jgi:hypothetical protein